MFAIYCLLLHRFKRQKKETPPSPPTCQQQQRLCAILTASVGICKLIDRRRRGSAV